MRLEDAFRDSPQQRVERVVAAPTSAASFAQAHSESDCQKQIKAAAQHMLEALAALEAAYKSGSGNANSGSGGSSGSGSRGSSASSIADAIAQCGSKKNAVVVFTTSGCPWCKKMKELLEQKEIPFYYIELDKGGSNAHNGRTYGDKGVPHTIVVECASGNVIIDDLIGYADAHTAKIKQATA